MSKNKFLEEHTETMAKIGTLLPDGESRDAVLSLVSSLGDAHDEQLELAREEWKKLLEDEEHDEDDEDDEDLDVEITTGDALAKLFGESDGRALLERAFRANPIKSERELTYLGGYDISGELKVLVELEGEADPTPEERELHFLRRQVEGLSEEIESPGDMLSKVFSESDGRALIERAYRADPKRTTVELNYLGAHRVADELSVVVHLEQQPPPPSPAPPAAPAVEPPAPARTQRRRARSA
jgi:hypothetical protein